MNEAPDAEREPNGYIRLPLPVVGGGLFILLAALLAFGLFANRNLRPQLAVAPTAASVGEPPTPGQVEPTPTSLAVAAPTQIGTATVSTATAQPTAVSTATVAATATPPPATG